MKWLRHPATKKLFKLEKDLLGYEKDYIDLLVDEGALKFGRYTLKSGRFSPVFLNHGDINKGESIEKLGEVFAKGIRRNFGDKKIKTILGPAYKAIAIAVATSTKYSKFPDVASPDVHYTFDRKEEKSYGEATGVSKEDVAKKMFVGYIPKDGDEILLLDDLITTGLTKLEEIEKLDSVVNTKKVGVFLGTDREEIDENGNNPIRTLQKNLNVPVGKITGLFTKMVPYLYKKGKINSKTADRLKAYARTYGVEEVKSWSREIKLIEKDKGIIPACDIKLKKFEKLVKETRDIDEIVAYKVGITALNDGLDNWVKVARKHTDKPIIYDHQKAGTDIPDTGETFANVMKKAKVDAAIIFPLSGPETQLQWIHALFDRGIDVISGGHMTHKRFSVSEGGYIDDKKINDMYALSARAGVNGFVMPGNKIDLLRKYKAVVESSVGSNFEPAIYSPGLVAQGGKISEATEVAGPRWYAIVGRGIYTAKNMRDAAFDHAKELKGLK